MKLITNSEESKKTEPFRVIIQFDVQTTNWDEAEALGERIGQLAKEHVQELSRWMLQDVYHNVPYDQQI